MECSVGDLEDRVGAHCSMMDLSRYQRIHSIVRYCFGQIDSQMDHGDHCCSTSGGCAEEVRLDEAHQMHHCCKIVAVRDNSPVVGVDRLVPVGRQVHYGTGLVDRF